MSQYFGNIDDTLARLYNNLQMNLGKTRVTYDHVPPIVLQQLLADCQHEYQIGQRRAVKAWQRFYGFSSKYSGSGILRHPPTNVSHPGDFQEWGHLQRKENARYA